MGYRFSFRCGPLYELWINSGYEWTSNRLYFHQPQSSLMRILKIAVGHNAYVDIRSKSHCYLKRSKLTSALRN